MVRLNKVFLVFFVLMLFSCVKKDTVDFTQADNISTHQQLSGSLINFNATLPDFSDTNNLPFNTYIIDAPLDVFIDTSIQSNLQKVTFQFNFDNTFNRDFEIVYSFLDVNGLTVYSTTVVANKLTITNKDITVEGADLGNLKKSTKVNIVISLLNSATIDNTLGASLSINLNATLDLTTNQQVNASLISVDTFLSDFTDVDNLPFTIFEFNTPLDIFNLTEIQDNLKKVTFHFEIENTFNRNFEFVIEFLNDNDIVTYSFVINLDKTSTNVFDQFVEGVDLQKLKKSNKFKVHANVINSTTIDNTPNAFINFKSSATYFF